MNQYPGMPPVGPIYPTQPSRRQDSHYAASPHHHYVPFYAPSSPHPGPIPYGPHPQYIPQWYSYQQYPYPVPAQPRHYPQHSPLVVSSTISQPVYPPHRQYHHQQPPPPAQTPLPDHSTPSTTSQAVASPSTTPITTSDTTATPPIVPTKSAPETTTTADSQQNKPFSLQVSFPLGRHRVRKLTPQQLPWYSVPEASFPPRVVRRRRKRRSQDLLSDTPSLPLFPRQRVLQQEHSEQASLENDTRPTSQPETEVASTTGTDVERAPHAQQQQLSATNPSPDTNTQTTSTPTTARKRAPTRPVVPAIPNLPRRTATAVASAPSTSNNQQASAEGRQQASEADTQQQTVSHPESLQTSDASTTSQKREPPKSWAELLRSKNSVNPTVALTSPVVSNGGTIDNANPQPSSSLPDTLRTYDVGDAEKISFLEPRGLVNTGNMCYMNSVRVHHPCHLDFSLYSLTLFPRSYKF